MHGEPLDTSKTARLWDMSRSAPVGTLAFEDADGMAAFSPDGKYFATPDRATLGLWDLTAGREVARIANCYGCHPFSAEMGVISRLSRRPQPACSRRQVCMRFFV